MQTGYIIFNQKNEQQQQKLPAKKTKQKKTQRRVDETPLAPPISTIIPPQNIQVFEKKEDVSNEQKLEILAKSQDEFEFHIKAFWLFELIPNEVVVDIHKVSFIDKTFMYKNVTSIFIKDIAKIEVTNDLFFATLEIINMTQTIELQIKHLKKDDARIAQAIIQGLMAAYKNDIDLAEMDPVKIMDELQKLGTPVK